MPITIDKLLGEPLMHDHSESDLGAVLDSRYVNVTGDTMTGNLVMSGANIDLGTNYLVGEGGGSGVYVDGSGNVGIGTTSTDGKLTIGSSNSYSELVFSAGGFSNIVAKGSGLVIEQQNADLTLQTRNSGSITIAPDYNTGTGSIYLGTSTNGDTTRVYGQFDVQEGSVGIGTTSPDSLLSLAFSPSLTPALKVLNKDNSNQAILQLTTASNNARLMLWDSSNNQDVQIHTGGDSWFNGGNVGIGTTNPSTILDVNGVTTLRGNLLFGTDNTYDIGAAGDASRPRTIYAGGAAFSSPSLTAGDAMTVGGRVSANSFNLKTAGTASYIDESNGMRIHGSPTHPLKLLDGASTVRHQFGLGASDISYFNAGYVGIGTTTPGAKLHVNGTTDDQQLIIEGHSTQTANLTEWHNSSGSILGAVDPSGNLSLHGSSPDSTIIFNANNSTAFNTSSLVRGMAFEVKNVGSGTVWGISASVQTAYAGSVGSLYGMLVTGRTLNASTVVSSYYGINIQQPTITAGSVIKNTGLLISDINNADTLNYAIYTNAGAIHFGDKVEFTQIDGNEYIDSLADGYMDYGATTAHRFNNNVNITGKLHVNGTTDGQQLIIEGHSTQTANLTEWRNSSGTVLASMNASGGLLTSGARTIKLSEITNADSPYTAGQEEVIVVTSGDVTINLPTVSGIQGRKYEIRNSGTGTVTIYGNSTETVKGELTQSIYEGEDLVIYAGSTAWY